MLLILQGIDLRRGGVDPMHPLQCAPFDLVSLRLEDKPSREILKYSIGVCSNIALLGFKEVNLAYG
jgi:hypothetical protein